MNATDLDELSPTDRAFARAVRAQLRASEQLNYVEAARLSATRAQARELLMPTHRSSAWGWLAAPAAVAAIAFSLMRFDSPTPAVTPLPSTDQLLALSSDVNASTAAALEWVSDEAGPDFYRDLAFYEWLRSRSLTEPNA